jgi:hypothetical protein
MIRPILSRALKHITGGLLSLRSRGAVATVVLASLLGAAALQATENVPRKPFAQWADLPEVGQFVITPWYMESEAYHVWSGKTRVDINKELQGEDYGIDYMQGIIAMEYGISKRWAADLNIGFTTVGTRSFNSTGASESTTGLMDTTLGVRYQIFKESEAHCPWVPTLTFRAAGILPGSYDKDFPFAPGNHSTAIEPSLLFKKHVGWQGFGFYGDALYRWMRTSGDDQYILAGGLFQEIKGFTLNVGWRHLQCLSGYDLDVQPGMPLTYSPQVREISDSLEAGFNYRTSKRKFNYAFNIRKVLDGRNTASSFWLGVFADFPIGGQKSTP